MTGRWWPSKLCKPFQVCCICWWSTGVFGYAFSWWIKGSSPVCLHRNGLFTEMMNSECMSDRDYQGWVDFGRRDAEWGTTAGHLTTSWFRTSRFCSPWIFINKEVCRIITKSLFEVCWFQSKDEQTERQSEPNWMVMQGFIHRRYNLLTLMYS